MEINPSLVAASYREQIRNATSKSPSKIKLVGLLASDDEASSVYSDFTKLGCEDVGVEYEARRISKLEIEQELINLNSDTDVTGVIVYYPIFGGARDAHLRSVLSPAKDVEGLHPYWLKKLYQNERSVGPNLKAILPCTPLAVIKLLDSSGAFTSDPSPLKGKVVTIFNRSEVVGRPLAFMMSNDGAKVYSFDIDGPSVFEPFSSKELETKISREEALSKSDIIITGVPNKTFDLIKAEEIKDNCVYVNFSSFKNYDESIKEKCSIFIPRVGPVTVAMCLRNVLRLNEQFSNRENLGVIEF